MFWCVLFTRLAGNGQVRAAADLSRWCPTFLVFLFTYTVAVVKSFMTDGLVQSLTQGGWFRGVRVVVGDAAMSRVFSGALDGALGLWGRVFV